MERGREMIGLSYWLSTREGRAPAWPEGFWWTRGRDALVAAAPRRRPSPHRTRQARPFTHWRGTENDRMERGREMIGLSYRSSTREGRACRGRTPSASVPPSDATSASLPFRTCRGRTPSASVPPSDATSASLPFRISFVSPRAPC